MKVIAPVNGPKEAQAVIEAGADEVFCGVMPRQWLAKYGNVASPNRREWSAANIADFDDLKEVVDISHSAKAKVLFALNALYTDGQYPLVIEQVKKAAQAGCDALIVADIGLLLKLKKMRLGVEIHVSTGGTVFNSGSAAFFRELGAARIVLPRQMRVDEIGGLIRNCRGVEFEVFILNSGCKNIDGFCTFHHGVKEAVHSRVWNIPKRLNLDRLLLDMIRMSPKTLSSRINCSVLGIDSACLLDYKVSVRGMEGKVEKKKEEIILRNVSSSFKLITGADTCGACRLAEFSAMGVTGVKIVGRNYSLSKKVKDVRFIKGVLSYLRDHSPLKDDLRVFSRDHFRRIYGMKCAELCYYPD